MSKKFLVRLIPQLLCGYVEAGRNGPCKHTIESEVIITSDEGEESVGRYCHRHAQIERRRLEQAHYLQAARDEQSQSAP